jgi:hypothetical protein
MVMRSQTALGVALILIAAGAAVIPATAQQSSPARQGTLARRPDVPTGRSLPATARGTTVMGFAWTATNDPIIDASVRLRNVLTGQLEATAITTQTGEFLFENIEGGSTYVVELLSENGGVRAVGHPFTVAAGETVATFVRLGVPAPWFTGMFGNTAAAVVSTAASAGIAAVAPPEQNASSNK